MDCVVRPTPKSNLDKGLVVCHKWIDGWPGLVGASPKPRGLPSLSPAPATRSLKARVTKHWFSIRYMAKTAKMRISFIHTAVLAVLAAVALLASGHCQASCGEYVYSRYRTATHQETEVRRHDSQNVLDNLKSELVRSKEENGVSHQTFPVLPIPCSGPGCSQNPTPSLPVAPATTIGNSHQDRLISGQPDIELPSNVSHRRDLNDSARALRGFPLLIEMPPEFVA